MDGKLLARPPETSPLSLLDVQGPAGAGGGLLPGQVGGARQTDLAPEDPTPRDGDGGN